MIEPPLGHLERLQRSFGVTVHFRPLALQTGSGPVPDVFLESMPDELSRHKLPRRLPTGMRKAVYGVKHAPTPNLQYDGSGLARGDITKERGTAVAEGDVHQPQAGDLCPVRLDASIRDLVSRHPGVIHTKVYSAGHGAGETIGHLITLPGHVTDIRRELRDEGELPLLPGRPRLGHFSYSKRQWLMVHEGCE